VNRFTLSYGWQPRAYFWDGGWIGIGKGQGVVPTHAHHAVQITLSLDGPIRLRAEAGEWKTYQGAVVRPNVAHSFDPAGAVLVMLFVDPECREGRWLCRLLTEPITELPPERFACCLPGLSVFWHAPLSEQQAAELVTSVVHNLCGGPPPPRRMDERIAKALTLIRNSDAPRIPIEQIAKKVFLSQGRFAHLFTEEVGVPFRHYVLWRKLSRAMLRIGRGGSLSAVAHASGFADSAHLTRTFYKMYGIAPSVMLGRGEFYEIPSPFELEIGAAIPEADGRTVVSGRPSVGIRGKDGSISPAGIE
jgi:AraC family transcriptional regulator